MRRKEKEITDMAIITKILNEAQTIRLAMCDEGEPYLVAMNFAYEDGCLLMHSAKEGRKIDVLKKNNRVAFQMDTGVELMLDAQACRCGTKYLSVFGTGRAFFIDEKALKIKALDAIMTKHAGKISFQYPSDLLDRTLVIKVEVDSMTGKKSG